MVISLNALIFSTLLLCSRCLSCPILFLQTCNAFIHRYIYSHILFSLSTRHPSCLYLLHLTDSFSNQAPKEGSSKPQAQPHWPLCYSSNMPRILQPQALVLLIPLLRIPFPQIISWLACLPLSLLYVTIPGTLPSPPYLELNLHADTLGLFVA